MVVTLQTEARPYLRDKPGADCVIRAAAEPGMRVFGVPRRTGQFCIFANS